MKLNPIRITILSQILLEYTVMDLFNGFSICGQVRC